jgi:hypothetical protein
MLVRITWYSSLAACLSCRGNCGPVLANCSVLYRTGTGAVEECGGFVGLAGFDVGDERNLVATCLTREAIKHPLAWGDDECAVAADLADRTGAAQLGAGRFELESEQLDGLLDAYARLEFLEFNVGQGALRWLGELTAMRQ